MARRRHNKEEMAMDGGSAKHWAMHKKMMGSKMIILGALIIANAYWGLLNWPWFIGGVLVLAGIAKLAMPGCRHCGM